MRLGHFLFYYTIGRVLEEVVGPTMRIFGRAVGLVLYITVIAPIAAVIYLPAFALVFLVFAGLPLKALTTFFPGTKAYLDALGPIAVCAYFACWELCGCWAVWDSYFGFNAKKFKEEMQLSTSPVSAFFLMDSMEAISRCARELGHFSKYGMPSMEESPYFSQIREIYRSGKEVVNIDHDVALHWEGREYMALLRCHFHEKGQYELEMWLPGVIANDAKGLFRDGRKGFFCAFMPPAYYD